MSEELKVGDWVILHSYNDYWNGRYGEIIDEDDDGVFYFKPIPPTNNSYDMTGAAFSRRYLKKIDPPIAEEKPKFDHWTQKLDCPSCSDGWIVAERYLEGDRVCVKCLDKSISTDMHITASDLEAINKMEIEAKQYCNGCGRWIGRMRIDAGLTECMACENKVKQSLSSGQSLAEAGKQLDGANKKVYAKLTSHLREVK